VTLPQGTTLTFTHDTSLRETSRVTSLGESRSFTYGPNDRIESMTYLDVAAPPPVCSGDSDCDGVLDDADNCPAIANPTQSDTDSAQGLLDSATSAWRFDDPLGSGAIDTAGDNDGSIEGGATRTASPRGEALVLDGSDDHVEVADSPSLNPERAMTMAMWVKPAGFDSYQYQTLFWKGDSYSSCGPLCSNRQYTMIMRDDGWLYFAATSADMVGIADSDCNFKMDAVALDQWMHVTGVVDSDAGEMRLYVDGVEKNVCPFSTAGIRSASLPLRLGRGPVGGYFHGEMDEVLFYDRGLSSEEIAQIAAGDVYPDAIGDACDLCPGSVDPACVPTTCIDADSDGYGAQGDSACGGDPAVFDCDDGDAGVYPGAIEVCNGVDDDCDGQVDDGCTTEGGVTDYEYDAVGRFSGIVYPHGGSVRYVRDALDRVTEVRVKPSASAADVVTAYEYDENGNLEFVHDPEGGTTTYVYDDADRLTSRTLPNGVVTSYGYDDRDRVLSVVHTGPGGVLASVVYERADSGEPTKITREDGSYVVLTYDAALRLDTETYYDAADNVLDAIDYDYDLDGNRTSKNSLSGGFESYTYEPGFKLASVSGPGGTELYGHDDGGRLVAIDRDGVQRDLEYNSDDKITRVLDDGVQVARYEYDGVGRKVAAIAGGTTRRYLTAPNLGDGFETPQAVVDEAGALVSSFVFAGEHPIARVGAGGEVEYFLQDAMGSVIGMADGAG